MRLRFIVGLAELGLGFAVACSNTEAVGGAVASAGAAGAASDTTLANAGQAGAGQGGTGQAGTGQAGTGQAGTGQAGASVNGGQAGTAGKCWELQAWSPDGCGACQMTMAQYCADNACTTDPLPTCDGLPSAYSIDEGCGLVQLRMSGHGGAIYTASIYDMATGRLKYHYDNGGRSAGCMPELTVGIKPICESWTTLCEGAGGA